MGSAPRGAAPAANLTPRSTTHRTRPTGHTPVRERHFQRPAIILSFGRHNQSSPAVKAIRRNELEALAVTTDQFLLRHCVDTRIQANTPVFDCCS